eukprot:CAMPEP_0117429370 /NCGR_PEP_ID=MMETSP0758-20121206/8933_1 /TAXON_ID=63605 /ORGANISM="Percolomonas cosmopolitus, Strain AE-1 (ATCC 50343)" /LENGTH=31 /DNA_ID= /DNA_START= /DNA_END= /DNA_ORIENTATION=
MTLVIEAVISNGTGRLVFQWSMIYWDADAHS